MPEPIACGHQANDQTKISLSPPTPTSHDPRARATARPSIRNEAAPYSARAANAWIRRPATALDDSRRTPAIL